MVLISRKRESSLLLQTQRRSPAVVVLVGMKLLLVPPLPCMILNSRLYRSARLWNAASITASAGDGMFSVRYYDGEVEDGVVRRRLRRDGDFESRSLSLGETVDAKCCVSGRSIGSTAGGSPERFLVLPGKVVDKVAAVGDKEDNGEEKYIVEFEAFAEHFDQLFCPAGHRATIPRKDILALYHPAASSASPGESKQRT